VLEGSNTNVFRLSFDKAINLPSTIKVTSDIVLSTEVGEVRSTTFSAEKGELTAVSLKPESDVVGADTILKIEITTAHLIPKKGTM
jgi:hypothetical protein